VAVFDGGNVGTCPSSSVWLEVGSGNLGRLGVVSDVEERFAVEQSNWLTVRSSIICLYIIL